MCRVVAQETAEGFPLLPELDPISLSDQTTDSFYSEPEPLSGALAVSAYYGRKDYLISHLQFGKESWLLRAALKAEKGYHPNFQLRYHDALVLGSFRPQWAHGLVSGKNPNHPSLDNPPHPASYSPLGAGVNLKYRTWGILSYLSQQDRAVKLDGDLIATLPKSKQSYLGNVTEKLGSFGIYRELQTLGWGAQFYHQSYDRAFDDEGLDSTLTLASLYARLSGNYNTLMLEYAQGKKGGAMKAEWDIKSGEFYGKFSYSRLGKYQIPSYAAKPLLLSSQDQRSEIRAEIRYRLGSHFSIRAGTTGNYRRGDIGDPQWLAHNNLGIQYRDPDAHLEMILYTVDREILIPIDSTYVDSRPTHFRVIISGKYQINPRWSTEISARYQHQEKHMALSSGSSWAQRLVYRKKRLQIKTGFTIISSANHKLYLPSDDDTGYEIYGKSMVESNLQLSYKFRVLDVSLSYRGDVMEMDNFRCKIDLGKRF